MTVADVRIVLTATDETGRTFEGTIKNIDNLQRSADQSGRAFGLFAGTISSAAVAMNRLELTELSLTSAAERVAHAQQLHNEAVEKFGPNSDQAAAAARQLEIANHAMERAETRARISTIILTADMAQLALQVPKAAAAIRAFNAAVLFTPMGLATVAIGLTAMGVGFAVFDKLQKKAEEASKSVLDLGASFGEIGGAADIELVSLTQVEQTRMRVDELEEQKRRAGSLVGGLEDELAELRRVQDLGMSEPLAPFVESLLNRVKAGGQLLQGDLEKSGQLARLAQDDMRGFWQEVAQLPTELPAPLAGAFGDAHLAAQEAAAAIPGVATSLSIVEDELARFARESGVASDELASLLDELERARAGAIGELGVDLGRLSVPDLRILGLDDLAKAKTLERELMQQALDLHPALLDQLDVMADKGETSEELARALGLTTDEEARLRAEGRLTEEGIISQEEAMRRAAAAAASLSSEVRKLNQENRLFQPLQPAQFETIGASFGDIDVGGGGGARGTRTIEEQKRQVSPERPERIHLHNFTLDMVGGAEGFIRTTLEAQRGARFPQPFNARNILDVLQGRSPDDFTGTNWIGLAGGPAAFGRLVLQAHEVIPREGAAKGFSGLVTRRTMFEVAEDGPEYVSVLPSLQANDLVTDLRERGAEPFLDQAPRRPQATAQSPVAASGGRGVISAPNAQSLLGGSQGVPERAPTFGSVTINVHLAPGEGTPRGIEEGVVRGLRRIAMRRF